MTAGVEPEDHISRHDWRDDARNEGAIDRLRMDDRRSVGDQRPTYDRVNAVGTDNGIG